MSKSPATSLSVLAGALLALGIAVDARPALAGESCHDIHATGVGQNNGDLSTDAVLSGGGLLQGTTHTVFTPTGFDPTTLTLSFTALLTFDTRSKATLDVALVGTFNVATGVFSAVGTDMSGTGKLAGAEGSIALDGVEDATGAFTETVTGRLCVDPARR